MQVRLYEVSPTGQTQPKAMYSHEGPVLDICWSKVGLIQFASSYAGLNSGFFWTLTYRTAANSSQLAQTKLLARSI